MPKTKSIKIELSVDDAISLIYALRQGARWYSPHAIMAVDVRTLLDGLALKIEEKLPEI